MNRIINQTKSISIRKEITANTWQKEQSTSKIPSYSHVDFLLPKGTFQREVEKPQNNIFRVSHITPSNNAKYTHLCTFSKAFPQGNFLCHVIDFLKGVFINW